MCFMGWVYEIICIVSWFLTPIFDKFGIPNGHWIDTIGMLVAIRFCHLMNDKETKGILSEENWYEGIRYMLGIYIEKPQPNVAQVIEQEPKNNSSESHDLSPINGTSTTSAQNKVMTRQYNSMSNLLPSPTSNIQNSAPFRRHSLPKYAIEPLPILFKDPICALVSTRKEGNIVESTPITSKTNKPMWVLDLTRFHDVP